MADQEASHDLRRGVSPLQRLNSVSLHGQTPRESAESVQTPEGSRHGRASENVEASFVGPSGSGFPSKPKRGSESGRHSEAVDWGDFRIPKIPRPSVEGFSEGGSSLEDDSGSSEDASHRPGTSVKRSRCDDTIHASKREKLSDSSIFDPFACKQVDNLSKAENEFLEKYKADPIRNPQLLEEISDSLTAPVIDTEAIRKPLNPEILDMDKGFLPIATRLGTAFGPLTNVWSDSRGARNNPENLDVKTACNNLEKSMFALGKAHNTILFARRNSSLGSFFRDRKKAGDIVKRNQQV